MTTEHTRDELINVLERIKQKMNTLNKNKNQIQRLKKRTSLKQFCYRINCNLCFVGADFVDVLQRRSN